MKRGATDRAAIARRRPGALQAKPAVYGAPGRAVWDSAETPSPTLLIPITNVPSYVHGSSEIA